MFQTFQTPLENHFFPAKHRLQHNITARYIRVLLKDWIKRPQITMELYGCEGKLRLVTQNSQLRRYEDKRLGPVHELKGRVRYIVCRVITDETIYMAGDVS